jgi:uncharacterized RDD family membrane protein YckC
LDHEDLYPSNEMNLTQMSEPLPRQDYSNPYAAPNAPIRKDDYAQMADHEIVYAGFWKRVAAYFIDTVLASIVIIIIILPIAFLIGLGNPESISQISGPAEAIINLLSVVVLAVYFAWMESSPAQATFGKQMVGIKVCLPDGERISFLRGIGRFFGKYISALILGVGFIMAGLTQRKQGLHDLMASTLVVDKHAFTSQAHLQKDELGGCATAALAIFGIVIIGYIAMIFFVFASLAGSF